MSTEQPPQSVPSGSRFGALVVLGALGVAVLATAFAGLVAHNAYYGRLRDRAIWGVLLMAVGAIGPIVAVLVLVLRRRIVQSVNDRRWGAVAVFPGSFVVLWGFVFLGYGVLGGGSRTAILPHTPIFVVQFGPDGATGFATIGEFGGDQGTRGERYTNGVLDGDISFTYRVTPGASGESAISFVGGIKPPAADRAELHGTLVLKVKVRMRIEGLSDAKLTINDEPREFPLALEPGTYRIAIRGIPPKE